MLELHPDWEFVSDRVMGGISSGRIETCRVAGRPATRLLGDVSLENGGGFVQMAFDLGKTAAGLDLSGYAGIVVDVFGNGQSYDLRLRTLDLDRPWQSFRLAFQAPPEWQRFCFAFDAFRPHRTQAEFDPANLRRIGIVAVGQAMQADVSVSRVALMGR